MPFIQRKQPIRESRLENPALLTVLMGSDRHGRQMLVEGAQVHCLTVGTVGATTVESVCHFGASAGLTERCEEVEPGYTLFVTS